MEARANEAAGAAFVKGLVDEELFPNYVLAVHSSRAVMVDQVPMADFCLADTLLLLATTNGKRHEVICSAKVLRLLRAVTLHTE